MTNKQKFVFTLILIFSTFFVWQAVYFYHREMATPSLQSLLSRYYQLKNKNSSVASEMLDQILKYYPSNQIALREKAYWYLKHGDPKNALLYFEKAYQNDPQDVKVIAELTKLYTIFGEKSKIAPMIANTLQQKQLDPGLLQKMQQLSQQADIKTYVDADYNVNIYRVLRSTLNNYLSHQNVGNWLPLFEDYQTISLLKLQKMHSFASHPEEFEKRVLTRAHYLNQFYELREQNKQKALAALEAMLQQYPQDTLALKEAGYFYLAQKKYKKAFEYLEKAYHLTMDKTLALQLAFIADRLKIRDEAIKYFKIAAQTKDEKAKRTALKALAYYRKMMAIKAKTQPVVTTMSRRDQLLNAFYDAKKTNPARAWQLIVKFVNQYPYDVQGLKEAGYFALDKKNQIAAFHYLNRAYFLTQDAQLALQVAYILDGLGEKKLALKYFKLATKAKDCQTLYKAEIAVTNLSSYQSKIFPEPYYAEIFANPFYLSRFRMFVEPYVARLGRVVNDKYQWRLYLSWRRTTDNRTDVVAGLPQIFEDNVLIYALGTQVTPFPTVPLIGFAEAGRAKDLVYRDRPRWRGDFRGGFAYYNEWGRETRYTFSPRLCLKFLGDIYGDAIYFSRYRNLIFTLRFRPGFEVFRSHTTSLALYLRTYLIQDTEREFFNNLIEAGFGARFVPSDRLNLAIRYELNKGYYLPTATSSQNPYGPNYSTQIFALDFFIRL